MFHAERMSSRCSIAHSAQGGGGVSARELWVGGRLLDVWDGTLVVENTRLELTEKLVRVYNFQMKKPKRPSMRVMEKI